MPDGYEINWPLFTAALAATAAVVQAVAAFIMVRGLKHSAQSADAAARAVEHADRTSKQQLRAYIDREKIEFMGFVPGGALVRFTVRNFGQTAAKDVRCSAASKLIARAGPPQSQFLEKPGTPIAATTTIAPGASANYYARLEAPAWEPHINSLADGSKVVIFKVEITYQDVFDAPHRLMIAVSSRGFYVEPDPVSFELVARTSD